MQNIQFGSVQRVLHQKKLPGQKFFPIPLPGREHPLADSWVVERTISGSSSDPIRFLGNILPKIRKQ